MLLLSHHRYKACLFEVHSMNTPKAQERHMNIPLDSIHQDTLRKLLVSRYQTHIPTNIDLHKIRKEKDQQLEGSWLKVVVQDHQVPAEAW